MQGFARMSKLTNIRGRADYISNPARQEHIVIQSAAVDWQPYHDYEQANRKSAKANNEGREIILALPNEWAALPHEDLSAMVAHLAQAAVGKSTDLQWAVHWNKEHTNLHAHIIFSERTRTATGVYDRDVYLTDDGKVARRKADRARDKDGNIKPPVHRKGEPKGGFSAKNPMYKDRKWLKSMKTDVYQLMEFFGATIDKPHPLHQYHEGKGSESAAIHKKNEHINRLNKWLNFYEKHGFEFPYPPSDGFQKMFTTLMQPKVSLGIYTAISLSTKKPDFSYFNAPDAEFEKSLRDKMLAEHIPSWKGHDGKVILFREHFQRMKELYAAVKAERSTVPPPPPQQSPPVDIDQIIALKQDYVRKCCVLGYLNTAHPSSDAQEDYQKAQKLVADFAATIEKRRDVEKRIKATINPITKIMLSKERDRTVDQLYRAAMQLKSALGITLVYGGREVGVFSDIDHYSAIYGYTKHPMSQKRAESEKEIERNKLIQTLSTENIDEKAVQTALAAFQTACKAVPAEQQQTVYIALQNAPAPLFEFETAGYWSKARKTAAENVAKAMSILKPETPPPPPTQQQQLSTKKKNRGLER